MARPEPVIGLGSSPVPRATICSRSAVFFLVSPGTSPIEARTGLAIDPQFPAKIAWSLDAAPGARARGERGELRAGTVDSRLLWNLTGGPVHATDHSNAARTHRFDITNLAWDDELCALFAVRGSDLRR